MDLSMDAISAARSSHLIQQQHYSAFDRTLASASSTISQNLQTRATISSNNSSLMSTHSRCLRSSLRFHSIHPQAHNAFLSTSGSSESAGKVKCAIETGSEESKGFKEFLDVANQLADAAAEITLKYFRTPIQISEKLDKSPVTLADQEAENAMRTIILQHFPSHMIYGEEGGLTLHENGSEYAWVLDPIDGTKSFITGKPLFGTLIALVHGGIPILGVIDQPVLKERWIGQIGCPTTLNGKEVKTRPCASLSNAYMYTTSPHLFYEQGEVAYEKLRKKVKVPLYGCDCYAYGLLAAGHIDLVVESGLKPYDYLALVPVIEGSGGIITNWNSESVRWWPSNEPAEMAADIIAAGATNVYNDALEILAER